MAVQRTPANGREASNRGRLGGVGGRMSGDSKAGTLNSTSMRLTTPVTQGKALQTPVPMTLVNQGQALQTPVLNTPASDSGSKPQCHTVGYCTKLSRYNNVK